MAEGVWVPAGDGKQLYVHRWLPKGEKPTSVAQIIHGMAEHGKRYEYLAQCLNEKGVAVYAQDLRGHGNTAENEDELGFFAGDKGWERAVDDVCEVSELINKEYPALPLFLIGHSMGSFLARAMMYTQPGPYEGVVLSGTGGDPGIMGLLGKRIALKNCRKYGYRHRDKKLDAMSFGSYNRKFRPNRTPFDWLSRDEEQVDRYVEDPLCGFVCTSAFFRDLLDGLMEINHRTNLFRIPNHLPVLLISGTKDPVGKFGKAPRAVADQLREAGLRDVSVQLYHEARHELFQETNRDEVISDVVTWCEARSGHTTV